MIRNLLIKSIKLFLALSLIALGISLIVKAAIGQSTLSGLSYNLGVILNIRQGTMMGWVNFMFFAGQIAFLKKNLGIKHVFQLGMIMISTILTNFFLYDFPWGWLPAFPNYPFQLVLLLVGIAIMALGIALMMVLDFVFMPYEGFIQLMAEAFHWSFGTLRRNIDILVVVVSLILIFAFKIPNVSVREGTVLFALLVGTLNHIFIPILKKSSWKTGFERETS